MIQIQDDSSIQSVVSDTNQVAPIVSTPNQSNDDSANKNTAAIDDLLAELDKLSQGLDEKKPATVLDDKQDVAKTTSAEVKKEAAIGENKDDKFDFDAFLSDLEAKIDKESNKNNSVKSEPMTDFPDSEKAWEPFRKNRSAADVQAQDDSNDGVVANDVVSSELAEKPADSAMSDDEELKAQNIFEMLGLLDISDEEKNQFLDELESMIWDDFVVHDLEILLSSEEYTGARQILDNATLAADKKKENLIIYLEKLVPDLDEVLYDKAIELKSEMMGERLNRLKEGADEAKLAKVKEAEDLISQNLWKSATAILNALN